MENFWVRRAWENQFHSEVFLTFTSPHYYVHLNSGFSGFQNRCHYTPISNMNSSLRWMFAVIWLRPILINLRVVGRFHLVQLVLEWSARRMRSGLPSGLISSLTLLLFILLFFFIIRSALCVSFPASFFCFVSIFSHVIMMMFSQKNAAAACQTGQIEVCVCECVCEVG